MLKYHGHIYTKIHLMSFESFQLGVVFSKVFMKVMDFPFVDDTFTKLKIIL